MTEFIVKLRRMVHAERLIEVGAPDATAAVLEARRRAEQEVTVQGVGAWRASEQAGLETISVFEVRTDGYRVPAEGVE